MGNRNQAERLTLDDSATGHMVLPRDRGHNVAWIRSWFFSVSLAVILKGSTLSGSSNTWKISSRPLKKTNRSGSLPPCDCAGTDERRPDTMRWSSTVLILMSSMVNPRGICSTSLSCCEPSASMTMGPWSRLPRRWRDPPADNVLRRSRPFSRRPLGGPRRLLSRTSKTPSLTTQRSFSGLTSGGSSMIAGSSPGSLLFGEGDVWLGNTFNVWSSMNTFRSSIPRCPISTVVRKKGKMLCLRRVGRAILVDTVPSWDFVDCSLCRGLRQIVVNFSRNFSSLCTWRTGSRLLSALIWRSRLEGDSGLQDAGPAGPGEGEGGNAGTS